jgi:PKD repeat protein
MNRISARAAGIPAPESTHPNLSRHSGSRSMGRRAALDRIVLVHWRAGQIAAITGILLIILAIPPASANINGNTSVKLALSMNNTWNDSSIYGHIFTMAGTNISFNTTIKKFGNASLAVNNGSISYLQGDGSSDFAFNQSNWSIGGWFYLNSTGTASIATLYDGRPASGSGVHPYLYFSTLKLSYYVNGANLIIGSTTVSKDQWHYVRFTHIGNYDTLLLDGVNQSLPVYDASDYQNPSGRPYIGGRAASQSITFSWNGMMDDWVVRTGDAVSNSTAVPDVEFINDPLSGISLSVTSGTAPLPVTITYTGIGNTAITSHRTFATNVMGNNTQFILSTDTNPSLTMPVGNWSIIHEASNVFGISNSTPQWVNVSAPTFDHITNLVNLTYPRSIRWEWNATGYNYLYEYRDNSPYKTLNTADLSDYWTDLEPLTNYTFSAYTDTNATWVNRTVQTGYGPTDLYIMIDFDDCPEGVYDNAWPIMSASGINHANILVIGNRVIATNNSGVPGPYPHYMSLTNLTFLQNQHWNLTSHGDTHPSETNFNLSAVEIYNEIVNGTANMTRFGFTGAERQYNYRGGSNNESIRAIARAAGMLTGRSVYIASSRQTPNYPDLWNLTVTDTALDTHPPERIEAETLAGLTGHNQTATWVFHEISDTYTPYATYPIGNFTVLMHWIRDHGYKTITANEWYALDGASPPYPVAAFTKNATVVNVSTPVLFTDATGNEPLTWNWSFGDGNYTCIPMNLTRVYSLNTTPQAVTHSYAAPGTYTVTLNATNGFGYSLNTTTVTVNGEDAPLAMFTPSGPVTLFWPFSLAAWTDASTNSPASCSWSFGDGTGATTCPASHFYFLPGLYPVNFTATNAAGGSSNRTWVTVWP